MNGLPENAQERAALRSTVMRLLEAQRAAEQASADHLLAEEWALEEGRTLCAPSVPRVTLREAWHGTLNGYSHHGCRCPRCSKARSDSYYHYKAKGKTYR